MREALVRIRVSRTELDAIRRLAEARGLSLSELMRRSALGARMPKALFDRRQVGLLVRLLASLGHVGGNLNQLVRQINRGRLHNIDGQLPATLADIEILRGEIRELIR